ncbi:chlorophyllase [Streptomyces roseirectus]|uniref:Chlorophyllase n=1 Tax=Streptomyces roseirectus TaxID=2768066 RepID=A0A7H0IHI0_9ACTN|nr:alpha/beta fold hydrolase [Streptomyces roseirectus]QNP72246.1 chlorophyllase [Streptomyces roseirectus]
MPGSSPIVSVKPVLLPAPGRGDDLRVRVSAPLTGTGLPVLVFSHGFGSSMDGYAPLADHWAAHGFVVVQPTHLDSRTRALPAEDPRTPLIWRHRIDDVVRVLDSLGALEAAVPGLAGRVDRGRVAVAGHSWGAQTVGVLLGARVLGVPDDFTDPRVKAGVLLAAAGLGDELTPFAAEHLPFMRPSFASMTAPALVVAGDSDHSQLSTRGPDWFIDPYLRSPSPKGLLTLTGAEHSLGGIPGYESAETTDENPETVALIRRVSTAFLRGALGLEGEDWKSVDTGVLGKVESK